MNENLRPSTLGEILDRTTQLYRRNFWLFAGVAALPVGTMIALGGLAGVFGVSAFAAARGGSQTFAFLGLTLLAVLLVAVPLYLAAYVFSAAGLTQAAVNAHRGEKLIIRGVLKSVGPRFWTYLWFLVLQGILVALIPVLAAGGIIAPPIYFASRGGAGLATGVAIGFVVVLVGVAAIGVIVWLALSFSMGMAACVVERKTAWESLKRSWNLSKGTRGRIFVLFLLVLALTMVMSMIAYIPFMVIVGVAAAGNGAQAAASVLVVAEILQFVVNVLMQIVLMPISWIALVVFYYDQRVRKEGFDIEWMMEQAGLNQLTPPTAPAETGFVSGPALPPDTVEER